MIVFFDNCIPRAMARAMQEVQFDVIHLQEIWPDSKYPDGIDDDVWIAEVDKHGYVAISGDLRLTTKPANVLALKRAKIVVYILYSGFVEQTIPAQARWVFQHWHGIEEHAQKQAVKGRVYEIRSNGDIREKNLREAKRKASE